MTTFSTILEDRIWMTSYATSMTTDYLRFILSSMSNFIQFKWF